MNEADIKRSIVLGMDWCSQEHAAYSNSFIWLTQAARGEVPHGGEQPNETPVDEPITFDGPEMLPLEDGNE